MFRQPGFDREGRPAGRPPQHIKYSLTESREIQREGIVW